MNRRSIVVGAPLAAVLMLAACGGGASPAPATGDPGGVPAGTAPAVSQSPAGEAPATAGPATTTPPAAGPIDVCGLLTTDEVATLVAEPSAEPSADTAAPIPSYSCTWSAASSEARIPVSIAVQASPGFVTGSGSNPAFVKTMIEAEGNNPDNEGRVVDGLGDAASVTSVVAFDATVQFLQGDTLVAVTYTGENGAAKQDAVIELARAVAGRLP